MAGFQNPADALPDGDIWGDELRLTDMVEDFGFESIWTVEHHFTDYIICPDPVQFLTWVAARTKRLLLGTGVIVLPWHDPMRCAEQISVLDNVSGGRMILGLGRGLSRIEYEGFRVDMNTSREKFVEYATMVLEGLEQGYLEHDGEFIKQPRKDIRPKPEHSFKGRTYAAAVSPESMPIMAKLGIGLLVIPQKPWDVVKADFEVYNSIFEQENGVAAPPPLSGGMCFVDESADRAEEMAHRYISAYYAAIMKHYEFGDNPHDGVKGYEFYTNITKYIERHGAEGAAHDFVNLMPWGTPDQVLEKFELIKNTINAAGFMPGFCFGGMPYREVERNINLFAEKVLPELKSWEADPLQVPGLATAA